jgi:hypothetical protein
MTYTKGRYQNRVSFKKGKYDTEYFADLTYRHDNGRANFRYLNRETNGNLFFGDSHRVETSYNYRTKNYGFFFGGYSYTDVTNQHNLTLLHNKNLYSNRTHTLSLGTSFSHGEESRIGFNLSYRLAPQNSDYSYSSLLAHHEDTFFKQTLTQRKKMASFMLSNRLGVLSGDDFTSGYLQSSISSNNYGYANFELGSIESGGLNNQYLNSSFNVQFAGNSERIELVGRKNVHEGVLIDLADDDEEDLYELTINERKVQLKGGSKHLIGLDPHNGYNFSLVNKSNPYVRIVEPTKQVYLHRDNIYIPKWQKGHIELLYGKAFLDNKPLINGHLKNSISQGFSDENGLFALEVLEGSNNITVNGNECRIEKVENFKINILCEK